MAKRRSFLEDVLRIRVKGKPSKANDVQVSKEGSALVDFLSEATEGGNIVDISEFSKFRTLGDDRETQYRAYDEMCSDSVFSSALEMYADDSTQYNSKGQVIWAESENEEVSKFANRLIDILELNKNAWSHIYSLCKYGDVYLELFKDDESMFTSQKDSVERVDNSEIYIQKSKKGSVLRERLEMVKNPSEIFDLVSMGKTVGFVRVDVDQTNQTSTFMDYQSVMEGSQTLISPANKFVHIALNQNTDRFVEKFPIIVKAYDKESGEEVERRIEYDVNRGKSILYGLFKAYREKVLMEDSLLLNRVTRSSIIRLLQVEVGDMPKPQARELLKRMKQLIEQKNYMDKDVGDYKSQASPSPIDNVVYVPTHGGQGTVTMSNIGGDVDVKSIVDVDYFMNKIYAGLKIPKQFLGGDSEEGSLSAGTSLTKLDSRYARTIKRIQNAYICGIETLINLFALDKGMDDYVNNFKIKMTSPATTEDAERDEMLSTKLDLVDRFVQLLGDEQLTTPQTRKEVVMFFINNYLSEPDIAEILKVDETAEKITKQMQEEETEVEDDGFDGFSGGGSSRPSMGASDFDSDMDYGGDFEMPSDEGAEEEPMIDVGEE